MRIFFLLSLIAAAVSFAACQSAVTDRPANSEPEIRQVTAGEAKPALENPDVQLIDVRTAAEYEGGHAPRAENHPLDELEASLARLDREKPVYLICETGRRSQLGAEILRKNGFTDLYNIKGGISGWTAAGFPLEK